MRALVFAFSVILTATFFVPKPASACSCALPRTADQVLKFVPLVAWVRIRSESVQGFRRTYFADAWMMKGSTPIRIETHIHGATCGVRLPLNRPILVGLSFTKGVYRTSLCTQLGINRHRVAIQQRLSRCKPFQPCGR
jgi:hypothetical protein